MALKTPVKEHRRETTMIFDPENVQGYTIVNPVFRRKRVAAYARVSTEQDAQQSSYDSQVAYYEEYIKSKPEWEFVEVYSDEGISGTSMKKRDGFNRMIRDAENGKIDLILTKSVSRFSRNTVDSLIVTRKLRALGIEVFFEKENISSMDSSAEMVFTMMSSISQEESRSISENVRWGIRRRMESGKVVLPWSNFLGYEKGPDGLPKIVEWQAEIVRGIFSRLLEGASPGQIANELNAEGIDTPSGKSRWTAAGVRRILTNEKYKGDAILQKTFTVDFLTKEVRKNNGERPQWYIRDSHDAIVSPETFELAQEELRRRAVKGGRFYDSPFTNKIICGECGEYYGHKVWHSNEPCRSTGWICNHKYEGESVCRSPRIKDLEIERAFVIVANRLLKKRPDYFADYEQIILPMIGDDKNLNQRLEAAIKEREKLIKEIEALIADNSRRAQPQEDYQKSFDVLDKRFEVVKTEIDSIEQQISNNLKRRENIRIFLIQLSEMDSIVTEFDIPSWHALVDYIKIMPNQDIIFHLRNGHEETVILPDVI